MSASPSLRVLQVTPRLAPSLGGVETHVREVSRRLREAGVETEILTVDESGDLSPVDVLDGVPVRRARAYPAGRDYLFSPSLYRRVRRERWDVVHVQSYHTLVAPLAMAAAARAGVPYVVTFHGGGSSSATRNQIRGPQLRGLRPLLARAQRLVAIADFEVERYGALLNMPASRFTKIPNGADLPHPQRVQQAEGTLVVSSGRLESYKGHHRVIAALPHVAREVPDVRLWIAGSGPAEDDLRELAKRVGVSDRVEIGAVDRTALAERLAGASLAVLLSDFESHPLAALEAAALHVPLVVSADRAGLSELAAKGAATAVSLTDPPEEHARVMTQLIRDPKTRPIEIPTWDDCASALTTMYREVALGQGS